MKKAVKQSTLTFIMSGVSILAMFLMAVAIILFSRVTAQIDQANEDRFALTSNANKFMNGSTYLTDEVRAYAATANEKHYNNYWNEVNNVKSRDEGVAAMKEIGITQDEQEMINKMSGISNELVPLEENAMVRAREGDRDGALAYVYGEEYTNSIAQIKALREQFLNTLDTRTAKEIHVLSQWASLYRLLILITVILVALIQVQSILVIRRRILAPLVAVRDQMGEIATGNLSAAFSMESDTSEIGTLVHSIHVTKEELKTYIKDIDEKLAQMANGNMNLEIGRNYQGEFRPIQEAMSQIIDALNAALIDINMAAEHVTEKAEEVSADSQTLTQGATEQAASIKELSDNSREMSEQVKTIAQDASTAHVNSIQASQQLILSNEKMKMLSTAMDNISNASNQIGGIIKTIEDIAFQTNILALNASVEATRAGVSGKGFAVVADEVRNLASKSGEAAQNTASLIENTLKLVKEGTKLTSETTEALTEAVNISRHSAELIEDIAASSSNQSQSLEELNKGMEQISVVVQTNASMAEKFAMSSQTLNNQAQRLKASVGRFRLKDEALV